MKKVTLISMDGLDAVNVTECLIFKENVSKDDIRRTLQEAVKEYCMTEDGRDELERNLGCFNLDEITSTANKRTPRL